MGEKEEKEEKKQEKEKEAKEKEAKEKEDNQKEEEDDEEEWAGIRLLRVCQREKQYVNGDVLSFRRRRTFHPGDDVVLPTLSTTSYLPPGQENLKIGPCTYPSHCFARCTRIGTRTELVSTGTSPQSLPKPLLWASSSFSTN